MTTATSGIQLRPGGRRGWPPAGAGRSGTVACLVYRAGLPGGRARAPAPDRLDADHEADRGFNCAPGRQDDRGQHRATGAGPAAGRGRLPGHGRLPADQLPVRAAGPGPGPRRAAGRLQVKNTEQELACQLDVDLPGTRPGGPPRVIIASSRVIDARWVTSQRVPALGRRIAMTCSFSLEPDT